MLAPLAALPAALAHATHPTDGAAAPQRAGPPKADNGARDPPMGSAGSEGFFERVNREGAGLRDAAKPLTGLIQPKLRFLDLSDGGHVDCSDVAGCPELQICYLHCNLIQSLEHIGVCEKLRKLDAHGNRLAHLPGPETWERLVNLEVLHLHTNQIQALDDVQSLEALPRITVLSLYRNPVSLHPLYRARLVRALASTLCVLDNFAVSLQETLEDQAKERGYRFGETFGAFSKMLRFNAAAPRTTRFIDHLKYLDDEVRAARTLCLRYNPVAMIQRACRAYRVRARMNKTRAARRLQGLTRGFLVRRRKMLGLDPKYARSKRMPDAFLRNVVWRVFFTADMASLVLDLVARATAKGSAARHASEQVGAVSHFFEWSEYRIIRPVDGAVRWSHTDDVTGVETSTKWSVGGVVRRVRTKAEIVTAKARQVLRARYPLVTGDYIHAAPHGSRLLARRPMIDLLRDEKLACVKLFQTVVTDTMRAVDAEARTLKEDMPAGERLLSWTAPNAMVLTKFLDMVDIVNADCTSKFWPPLKDSAARSRVRLMSDYMVQRLAAVVSIQACWRAHHARLSMSIPLQVQLRQMRGRVCLQRWWRWILLRRRLVFLRDLHDLVSNIDSTEVYLPESHFQRIDDIIYFPRMSIFIEQKRAIMLSSNHQVVSLAKESEVRQGYPRWTAAGCVPIVAEHSQNISTYNTNPTNSQIIQSAASMDPVCPAVRDILFLSHHNFIRFVYPSVAEARTRAAALFARTYKTVVGGSVAIRLMSKATLRRNGAANCIQSCFRGSRLRAAYVHYKRASSRMSELAHAEETADEMRDESPAVATHDYQAATVTVNRENVDLDDDLEVYGATPCVTNLNDCTGEFAGVTYRRDELTRQARDLREGARHAARQQNELELTQLAHLQLNARRQRQQSTQIQSDRLLNNAVKDMGAAADQYATRAKQVRAEDELQRRLQVERVKANKIAAREQLRREQLAADAARAALQKTERDALLSKKDHNDKQDLCLLAAVRRRQRVNLNAQRGMGRDHLFTANFVRQSNAIGKQIRLSEYRQHCSMTRQRTLAAVRSRAHQDEVRRQHNMDLFTVKMVEQQRRVATDTIEVQNRLATERAAALREETSRRVQIRKLREQRAQTSPEAILAAQRQPHPTRLVVAKFDDGHASDDVSLPPLFAGT